MSRAARSISVGLPTLSFPASTARTLRALKQQGIEQLELIIAISSASSEPIGRAQEELRMLPKSWHVLLLTTERDLSPSENFSRCLQAASGELFMWVADDDYLAQEFIAHAVPLFEVNGLAGVTPAITYFTSDGRTLGTEYPSYTGARRTHKYWRDVSAAGGFYGLYRREALLRACPLGSFPGWDIAFLGRLVAQGEIVCLASDHLYRGWTERDPLQFGNEISPHVPRWFPARSAPSTAFLILSLRELADQARRSGQRISMRQVLEISGFAARQEIHLRRAWIVRRFPWMRPIKRLLWGVTPPSVSGSGPP